MWRVSRKWSVDSIWTFVPNCKIWFANWNRSVIGRNKLRGQIIVTKWSRWIASWNPILLDLALSKIGNKLAAVWASAVKHKPFSAEYYTQLVSEVRRIELYRQCCVLESVPSELLADQRRLLRDIGRKLESDEMLDEGEEENFVLIMSKAATPLHLDLLDKG